MKTIGHRDDPQVRLSTDEIDVADGDDCGRGNNDEISSDSGDSLVGCEVFAEIPVQ